MRLGMKQEEAQNSHIVRRLDHMFGGHQCDERLVDLGLW